MSSQDMSSKRDPKWDAMKTAEIAYLADPTPDKRRTLYDTREEWLMSPEALLALHQGDSEASTIAARHFTELGTWREWANWGEAAIRAMAAEASRDAKSLLILTEDPVPSVANEAQASLAALLDEE